MKVSCPSCQTNYNIDDKRIPPGGAKLKCARCQNTFPIKPAEAVSAPAPAAVPLPSPGAADPYGAYNDFDQPAASEATRVVAMPVPSAAYRDTTASAAIPLPSPSTPDLAYNVSPTSPTREAIPLPGASDPYADPYAGSAYPAASEAVPLPGASDDYSQGYADAPAGGYDYAEDSTQVGSIPLPPPPADDPYAYAAEPQGGAIALPPPPSADGYETSNPFDRPPQNTAEVDTFGLPTQADPYAAAPQQADAPFAMPPPAEDPYAAAAPVDDPFALPPQADVTNLDFSEPPPSVPSAPPNVATDFGDVGFGEPVSASASIHDSLEFDPTSPTKPAGDDLEADLSAPLPPPPAAGTADGLEMLSFIDDAAKDNGGNKAKAGNARRFHVRRRSGKVFGPFEEGVIVKMLEDGQLLGNEDVSSDADSWTPIGTVPIFATAIQKLMEGPATPAAPSAPAMPLGEPGSKASQAAATATSNANMERLNQLYGGRMAAVAVVDNTSRFEVILAQVKKRLPLIIGTAAAVTVLGVGLGFGATRYGVFGLKKFFPSMVKQGSSEASDVDSARKALLADSFQGYKQARTLSEKVLAGKEYPEVRALW